MRPQGTSLSARFGAAVILSLAAALTGCATKKIGEQPPPQRGWIGGEFKLAEKPRFFGRDGVVAAFPSSRVDKQTAGILVTSLSSNAPARRAGLREGDLILEVNGEPATCLRDFRRTIDRTDPGTPLPLKIYRNGRFEEYTVSVGRETFRYQGVFSILFLPMLREPDLWPDPDFSLIALGYQRKTGRTELGSVESTYRRSCYSDYKPVVEEWQAWLVFMRLSKGKIILSQEAAGPLVASSRP